MSKCTRFIPHTLVLLLISLLLVSATDNAALSRVDEVTARVERSDLDAVKMSVVLPGVEIEKVSYDGVPYDRVTIPRAVSLSKEGDPDLPVIRNYVGIPDCEDVVFNYRITRETTRRGIKVAPRRLRDEKGEFLPTVINRAVYSGASAYPVDVVRIDRINKMRGQRIAFVDVHPVQYNPVTNEIRIIEEVEITLTFVNATGAVVGNVGPMQSLLQKVLVNYDQSGALPVDPSGTRPFLTGGTGGVCWADGATLELLADSVSSCGADYLIIMDDELDETLVQQLADKRADFNGLKVAIVMMSQIDPAPDTVSTPETIKDFIQDIYDDQSAANMADGHLGYVLLLGDAYNADEYVMIPSYYGYPEIYAEASDAYYSYLDGGPEDFVADVFLGRVPVNDISGAQPDLQLENVVNKILGYSRGPGDNFRNLMVAGDMSGVGGPDFNGIIDRYIPAYVETDLMRRDEFPGSDYQFSSNLADSINSNNYWLASGYGHGNPMYLAHTFFPQHYDVLTNTKYPLFMLSGCSMGYFDLKTGNIYGCLHDPATGIDPCDAMAEALLIQQHGAIGVYAYTRDESAGAAAGAYTGYYQAIFEEHAYSLGEILLYLRFKSFQDPNLKALTLFGDPALNIMWEEEASDTIDLAVRKSNIWITGSVNGVYVDNSSQIEVKATIENLGSETAYNVTVYVWDGPPDDPGSTVVGSVVIPSIQGFGGTYTIAQNLGFLGDGEHDVYIQVDPSGYDELTELNNTSGIVFYGYDYTEGFPVATSGAPTGAVTVAEVDPTSPGKETLACIVSNLTCFGSDGTVLWEFPVTSAPAILMTPCVGNVYKDGKPYCVVVGDASISIVDGQTGQLEQSIPIVDGNIQVQGQLILLTDLITDDNSLEIVIVKSFGIKYIEAYTTYEYGGSYRRWSFPVGTDTEAGEIAAGDINGDGDKEIVVIVKAAMPYYNSVYMIEAPDDPGGTPTQGWPPVGLMAVAPRSLALLQDGPAAARLDILASGGQSMAQVSRINYDGTIQYDDGQGLIEMPRFTAADADNDGGIEILAVASSTLWVLSADTGELEDDDSTAVAGTFYSVPLTADIDGDGMLEIVAAYRTLSGNKLRLQIFEENADPIGEPLVFPTSPQSGSNEQHLAVDDIDGNGVYEVVFMGQDGVLQAIQIGGTAGTGGWTQKYKYPTQTNIVEQPVNGTYLKDVSLAGDVRVLGSTLLQSEKVFVDAGTNVRVENGGLVAIYNDLRVAGSATDRVDIFSAGENPQAGAWSCIILTIDSYADISYCDIRHALYGIANWAVPDVSHVSIEDCIHGIYTYNDINLSDAIISGCTETGIRFVSTPLTYGTVTLDGVVFQDMETAIYNDNPDLVLVTNISGDYGTGIVANAGITVENSTISGGTGLGIHIKQGIEAVIRSTTVQEHESGGIHCDFCAATSEFDHVTVRENSEFGMKLNGVGLMKIDSCLVVSTDGVGILCETASPEITWCVIDSNQAGVNCIDSSHPVIGYSTIRYNTNGVFTTGNSFPAMGEGTLGGNNIIWKNTYFHIVNLNENMEEPVYAQYNYWGSPRGPKLTKLMGNIVYIPFLTSEPFTPWGVSPYQPEETPMAYRLGTAYPNPFNPSTTIQYEVPSPGGDVKIAVYDVAGRRIAWLLNGYRQAGFHTILWNGLDDRGRPVMSGIYFVQMKAGNYVRARKLVLLR